MNKKYLFLVFSLLLTLLTGCSTQKENNSTAINNQKIVVSAAASLQNALDEIKSDFISQNKLQQNQIDITYAGSGTLRQQIEQGAPSSIFISASEMHMKILQDKKLIEDVKPFVSNSLVLIVPNGERQFTFKNLKDVSHLSIGSPDTVPAGKYAEATLKTLNIWQNLVDEDKIVYAKDVRAVLGQVITKNVSAGIVYKTDALIGGDKIKITDIAPPNTHKPIIYPIGIVSKNSNELTKQFFNYLYSDNAKKVLIKYGFTPVKQN